MKRLLFAISILVVLAAVGCSEATDPSDGARFREQASAPAQGLMGQSNAPDSFLAYAHDATVRMPAAEIVARVAAVRSACMDGRHGTCTVLGEQQSSGQWPGGRLTMRAEPRAIEPLVAMAAEGGDVAQRSTQAEDLADAVRDNGLRRQRLEIQHARLSEFLGRKDIKAEDLIALSGQLSQIEAELQMAEQEAAQQQRRIRTNLLTLNFQSSQVTAASSELGQALGDSLGVLDASMAVLVTVVVAVLPFALVLLVLIWVLRAILRRRRRSAA